MTKCEICKYQNDCPDIVEENSIYCLTHRKIPKNFGNEYIEKQQLISWLEDKIRECNDTIKLFLKKNDESMFNGIEIAHLQDLKKIFQEVLDFVEKGGKNE